MIFKTRAVHRRIPEAAQLLGYAIGLLTVNRGKIPCDNFVTIIHCHNVQCTTDRVDIKGANLRYNRSQFWLGKFNEAIYRLFPYIP